MQTLAWETLFRSIPPQFHNILSLTTQAGIEISIQCLLRIESECIVIRGRLAGSQDAGRVYFIPYANIDHVGFLREMKETEFHEYFTDLHFPGRAESEHPVVVPSFAGAAVAAGRSDDLNLTPITPGAAPASRNDLPIKSEVLERFRNRNGTNGKPPSGA